jgi:hypothetical protein
MVFDLETENLTYA